MSISNKALRAMMSLSPVEIERLKEEFNISIPSQEDLDRHRFEYEIKRRVDDFDVPVLIPGIPRKSSKNHCKPSEQTAKQVCKRRKKNKNKKTHRKK